jgi:hypothetical protein
MALKFDSKLEIYQNDQNDKNDQNDQNGVNPCFDFSKISPPSPYNISDLKGSNIDFKNITSSYEMQNRRRESREWMKSVISNGACRNGPKVPLNENNLILNLSGTIASGKTTLAKTIFNNFGSEQCRICYENVFNIELAKFYESIKNEQLLNVQPNEISYFYQQKILSSRLYDFLKITETKRNYSNPFINVMDRGIFDDLICKITNYAWKMERKLERTI